MTIRTARARTSAVPTDPVARLGGDDEALATVARVVTAVRAAVVASIGVLVWLGPEAVRQHREAAVAVVSAAAAYTLLMLARPRLEMRRTRYAWLITLIDAAFTLAVVGLTGGATSPTVSILVLVIVAAAARHGAAAAFALTAVAGSAYAAVVLAGPGPHRGMAAGWWPLYLGFVAVLGVSLSVLAEKEQHARLQAVLEAQAEHAAAEEERDLRARLLATYQSQQDGLHVLLHEFRTPLSSLEALGNALVDERTPMTTRDRAESLRLANLHIDHLNEMLAALGDVALARQPAFAAGRIRIVNVAQLITAAADAVGLHPPRLQSMGEPAQTRVAVDAQGLRRVLTNLLENAARHGREGPVEVRWRVLEGELEVSVRDHGPGVAPESLGELTAKFVGIGDQRGTAGLGLWIVQQILDAAGGRLQFAEAEPTGLVATFRMPVT
ncbi:MAG: sensor histidine kinase [Sporichthyaceae bacterium]